MRGWPSVGGDIQALTAAILALQRGQTDQARYHADTRLRLFNEQVHSRERAEALAKSLEGGVLSFVVSIGEYVMQVFRGPPEDPSLV